VDALLGHAEQLGDVDEAQRPGRPHVVSFKSQMPEGVESIVRGLTRCLVDAAVLFSIFYLILRASLASCHLARRAESARPRSSFFVTN
jgi:hypothetical protein